MVINKQYKCAACDGIFDFIRDETWSDEEAEKEYKIMFPDSSLENRDIVCDDCWQIVKPK